MPSYEFKCLRCGVAEKFLAMGSAGSTAPCPHCGDDAKRVYSVPLLNRNPRQLRSVFERAEKSRDEPAVARREGDSRGNELSSPNPAMEKLVGKSAARDLRTAPHPAQPSR